MSELGRNERKQGVCLFSFFYLCVRICVQFNFFGEWVNEWVYVRACMCVCVQSLYSVVSLSTITRFCLYIYTL